MNIAIIGATGIVGRTAIKIIAEQDLNYNLFLFASAKSQGKTISFNGSNLVVRELTLDSLSMQHIDYALFCCKENISKIYIPLALDLGIKVIDFSNLYRKTHPLIVPEINANSITGNLVCNPNCSTIASVMALYKINQLYHIKQITYSTYQAVSGAGKLALDDLNTLDAGHLKKLPYIIKNNLIPLIGSLDNHNYSTEENKMMFETKKILSLKNTKITATCVRVPIANCHSISINFVTSKPCTLDDIKHTLANTPGVKYLDNTLPMPIDVNDQSLVYVGRLREDKIHKNGFNIFVVSDNLRKGAAQNGVQILQRWIEQNDNK